MGCGHWVSTVVVALALAGCSEFTAADTESSGDTEGDSSTGGTNPSGGSSNGQSSAGTASAGGSTTSATDPTNASNTDPTNASNTDPTNASNTDPTDPTDDGTTGSASDSNEGSGSDTTGGETSESSTESESESDSDPTTGTKGCTQQDVEPNDFEKEDDIVYLGEIVCGSTTYDFDGTIEDANDEDWLAYLGTWECGEPNPRVVADVADNNVEVCATPLCVQEVTAFYTCVTGNNWSEGGNNLGCCSTDVVRMDVNCSGTGDESLFVSFRVRDSDAVCEDYALSYAYEVQP